MRLRTAAGFTLTEIMAMVFIAGLLTTWVAPKVLNHYTGSKRTRAASDVETIADSLQRFHMDNGYYPSTGEGLEILVHPHGKAPRAKPEGYIEKIPTDPWGKSYVYLSDGRRFLLKSFGADGREGGRGSEADITHNDA